MDPQRYGPVNTIPSGTVTFLFTDIEGSTKLAQEHADEMPALLARHHAILRRAIQAHEGYIFQIIGDSFAAAFHIVHDALHAALEAQRELQNEPWSPVPIQARMGIHTGPAVWKGKDHEPEYMAYATLAMASRVTSAGHGRQILLSQQAYELAKDRLPAKTTVKDLGEYTLKDFLQPQAMYQVTATDLPSDFPPLKTLKTVRNNLPLNLTSFIGRERELAESQEKLTSARLLTLIGPGGTGKTRLSLQVALEQIGNFRDGVWLVELAPISEASLIVSTIATVFNLREVQSIPLINIITDYLRAKELLLLLDNCEHLVEASAKIVDQLLHECPYLKVITSSREALGISGETVYRVPSLKDDEAALLFIERATKANSRFQRTDAHVPFIAQICSRLDGIPLSIELAAARVNLFTPQQIAERLNDRFKLLTGGSRAALPRQQSLRALIDWSHQTLNETEQRALRRLAVFSGGWTFEAAESVIGESEALDGLSGLVNKSLVNVEEQDGRSRYSFLESIRQYALEKLLESGETTQTRDRHFDYFFEYADRINNQMIDQRKKKSVDLLELENDNLRSALRWGVEHHPLRTAFLLDILSNFWLAQGYLSEGQAWCDSALQCMEDKGDRSDELDLAKAHGHFAAAMLSNNQGRHLLARGHIEKAILIFRKVGKTELLARSLTVLATASGFSGDFQKAFEAVHECIRISRAGELKFELAWGLEALSMLTFETRGSAAAEEIDGYIQENVALLQQTNHPWTNSRTKDYLAGQALARGDLETARKYAAEALADYEEAGASLLATNYKSKIAHALRGNGNFAEALSLYRETILAYQDFGHRGAIAHQLECFAFIAAAREQGERALKLLGAAEALRETSGSQMTPHERIEYDARIASLRAGMDAQIFTSLWAEGRSMTMEKAIEFASESTHA